MDTSKLAEGLTGSDVTGMVVNANQINLLIWAIVVLVLILAITVICVTKIFISSSKETNTRYLEQTEAFRKSMDGVSETLRELSKNIARNDEAEYADEEVKAMYLNSFDNLFVAFRESDSKNVQMHMQTHTSMEKLISVIEGYFLSKNKDVM